VRYHKNARFLKTRQIAALFFGKLPVLAPPCFMAQKNAPLRQQEVHFQFCF